MRFSLRSIFIWLLILSLMLASLSYKRTLKIWIGQQATLEELEGATVSLSRPSGSRVHRYAVGKFHRGLCTVRIPWWVQDVHMDVENPPNNLMECHTIRGVTRDIYLRSRGNSFAIP